MTNKQTPPTYSIIIPCYNSGNSLSLISTQINDVFKKQIKASFEIIFVDDYSPNAQTWAILQKLQSEHDFIKIIQLTRNFGQHQAIICGMNHAQGQYIITMDDDGQHSPEDLPKLIAQQNHDIVFGAFKKSSNSGLKQLGGKIVDWLMPILIGVPKGINHSPYRLIKHEIIDAMIKIQTPFPFIDVLLFYISRDAVNVDVSHHKRIEGETGYNFTKLLRLFMNLLINNSPFLLRILRYGGLGTATISFLFGLYLIFSKVFFDSVIPGWTSIMVSIFFMGGATLLSLGIIGDYLWRIIVCAEKKPVFVVRHFIRGDKP